MTRLTFIAVLTLLAACSTGGPASTGSDLSPGSGVRGSASAVAYSRCLRSHGVPKFPDPSSNGQVPKAFPNQLGVSMIQLQAAERACRDVYPGHGGSFAQEQQQCYVTGVCPEAVLQQMMSNMRTFARCMRSHGVANYPDPTLDAQGRPGFAIPRTSPLNSPQVDRKAAQCEHWIGSPVPYP